MNQKSFERISTTLVCLMMACLGVSFSQLGQRMLTEWKFWVIPLGFFMITLERIVTYKSVKSLSVFSKPWFLFQGTQWIVILLILKIVLLVASPPESWLIEIQLWRIDFLGSFFDSQFTYAFILIFVMWMISGYFAKLLDEMGLEEALIRHETAIVASAEGGPVRERLLGLFFSIGFILIAITAIMRFNFRSLLAESAGAGVKFQPLPFLAAGSWNVLLYFLLGLGLMSLSQFARMNARWSIQKIESSPNIARNWAGYSLFFVLFVALFASLLPTNYSLGLLSALGQFLILIYGIVVFVVGFLLSILVYLIGLLAELLGLSLSSNQSGQVQQFIPPEIPQEVVPDGTNYWLDIIKSLVFWLVFLGVVGYAIFQFSRQHEELWRSIQKFRVSSWLSSLWQSIKLLLRNVNKQVTIIYEAGRNRLASGRRTPGGPPAKRLFQYRRPNNRQRILMTFFALVRRSDKKGITRGESQTPYEYSRKLKDAMSGSEEEISGVVDAFVTARYSQHPVKDDQVNKVRYYWSKIRKSLSKLKK